MYCINSIACLRGSECGVWCYRCRRCWLKEHGIFQHPDHKKVLVQEDEYNWFISKNISLKNSWPFGRQVLQSRTITEMVNPTIDLRALKKSWLRSILPVWRISSKVSSTQPNNMVVHVVNTNYDNTQQLVTQNDLSLNLKKIQLFQSYFLPSRGSAHSIDCYSNR